MRRNEIHTTEGLEVRVNHPLATLTDQFLKERLYLKNVTEATLVWYRVAFTNYQRLVPGAAASLPTLANAGDITQGLAPAGSTPPR